jgi:TetR/AcrR family transcriptional regulator
MEDVSNRILDAAMRVFSKEGYEGATTKKIAEMANVNEVTLFRKFRSKENILKTVISKNQQEAIRTLDSILLMEKSMDIQKCLLDLGNSIMEFMSQRMDFIIMLIAEGRKRDEIGLTLHSFLKKILEHLSEYFTEQITKGKMRNIDPDVAAFSYSSYIFYSNLSAKVCGKERLTDPELEFKNFVDMFTNGILNSSEDGI